MKRLKKIIDVKVLFSFLIWGLFSTFILLPLWAKAEGEDPVVINIPTEIQSEWFYPWISKLILWSGDEALELSITDWLKVSKICHSYKCVDVEKLYEIDTTIIPDITWDIESINSNIGIITWNIENINSNIGIITWDIESINQNISGITWEVSWLSWVVADILSEIWVKDDDWNLNDTIRSIVKQNNSWILDYDADLWFLVENAGMFLHYILGGLCNSYSVWSFYMPSENTSLSVCMKSGNAYSWVELANTNPNLE